MSARTKLNGILIAAALAVAAIAGAISQSWLVFVAVAVISTVLMIHAGEVRLRPGDHRVAPRKGRH